MKSTSYEPYDGDYVDADYCKLLNDIQIQKGLNIGAYLEICACMTQDNNKIFVSYSNDDGDDWEQSYVFEIPDGWELEKVREMFIGNVYLRTDDYVRPEQEEEEEE